MDNPLLKAQHYLDQADKMRRLAASENDETSRKALLELVKGYEKLAAKFLRIGQGATKGRL